MEISHEIPKETKKRVSDYTVEEIRAKFASFTEKDIEDLKINSQKKTQKWEENRRTSRTMEDIQKELLIMDKSFEIVRK